MGSLLTRGKRIILVLTVLTCCAMPAIAADDEDPPPFCDVSLMEQSKPYVQWIVGVLFAAACIAMAMKNPARTHLD